MNKYFWCLAFILSPLVFWGQLSPLSRKVTADFSNLTVEESLNRLESEAGFHFSYNTDLLPRDSLVQLQTKVTPVKKILDQLFGSQIAYKEIGNYIILKSNSRTPHLKKGGNPEEKYLISGYLIDKHSGEKLVNASVYQIDELNSTLTDPNGYYSLMVSATDKYVELSYSRENYLDTLIVVEPDNQKIDIELTPRTGKLKTLSATQPVALPRLTNVEEMGLVKIIVPEEQLTYANNLEGFFDKRMAQISLVPILGTNRTLSGLMVNNLSLNILAGYNGGVKGFELGGIFNIVRKDISGLQIGGIGNIVGGRIYGSQIGGFINNCRGSISGVQIAGFNNIVLDTISGLQIAGFGNIVKGKVEGVQIAGFGNITTKNVDGVEIAGFFNIAGGDVKNSQIGGFFNLGRNTYGTQIAGFTNIARGMVKGAQIGGFFNYSAKEIKGIQLSGFLNYAKKVKSVQLGIINISDSCAGVPIGFFSFVNKGFHKLELYSTETTQFNISYKSGVEKFYNIFSAGVGRNGQIDLWSFGYGLGTYFSLNHSRWYMNVDLTSNHISFEGFSKMFTNTLYRLNTNLNYRLTKKITLVGGPSFNMHIRDMIYDYPEISESYTFEDFRNGVKFRSWIGFYLGIRI